MQNYFLFRGSLVFLLFLTSSLIHSFFLTLSRISDAQSFPVRLGEGKQGQAQPGDGWAMKKGSMQRVGSRKEFKRGIYNLCLVR